MRFQFRKSRNKYGAKKQEFQGNRYDSGRECQEAVCLDLMLKAGEITAWERQVKIPLEVNGKHIANYYIDFVIHHKDGTMEYREVKGVETDTWRMKWRIFEALYAGRPNVLLRVVR